MENTITLLDAAKKAAGVSSDYALSKRLEIAPNRVSNYRRGKSHFDDDMAEKVAELLGREPGEIIALCQAERQKDDAGRQRWLRIAALLAMVASGPGASHGAVLDAPCPVVASGTMYIMSNYGHSLLVSSSWKYAIRCTHIAEQTHFSALAVPLMSNAQIGTHRSIQVTQTKKPGEPGFF